MAKPILRADMSKAASLARFVGRIHELETDRIGGRITEAAYQIGKAILDGQVRAIEAGSAEDDAEALGYRVARDYPEAGSRPYLKSSSPGWSIEVDRRFAVGIAGGRLAREAKPS